MYACWIGMGNMNDHMYTCTLTQLETVCFACQKEIIIGDAYIHVSHIKIGSYIDPKNNKVNIFFYYGFLLKFK